MKRRAFLATLPLALAGCGRPTDQTDADQLAQFRELIRDMAKRLIPAHMRYVNSNGDPLSGGKLYFYKRDTSDAKDTFSDQAATTANTNPIILDTQGRPQVDIWGVGEYKMVLTSASGTPASPIATFNPLTETPDTVASIAALTALNTAILEYGRLIRVSGVGGRDGLFYWDSASTATDNGGTVFQADSGGTGRWIRKFDGPILLRWFVPDTLGTTNYNSEVAAAVTAAAGQTLSAVAGEKFLVDKVSITTAMTLDLGGATVIEAADTDHTIHVTADETIIRNLVVEGKVTNASFKASPPVSFATTRGAIFLDNADDSIIENFHVTGKSSVVRMNNCSGVRTQNVSVKGFLTDDPNAGGISGANYATGIYDVNGADNTHNQIFAKDHGSAVTIAGDGERIQVRGVRGERLFDNGVYISSGIDCLVSDVQTKDVWGSHVKARGSRHIISNVIGENSINGSAIHITGNGTTLDSEGANGHGTIVSNIVLKGCVRHAIQVANQDGYPCRDVTLSNITIPDGTVETAYFPVNIGRIHGIKVDGLIVDGYDGEYCFSLAGSSGDPVKRARISNCEFRNNTGAGGDGMRLTYADRATCTNITGENLVYLIELRQSSNCSFIGCRRTDDTPGLLIRIDDAYTGNLDNQVHLCEGNVVADAATNTTESGNY